MTHTNNPALKQAACQPDRDGMTSGYPGTIQAMHSNSVSHGTKDCAHFCIDNVDKSLLQPEKSLNDLFSVGDKVHFDAQPNAKMTNCARKCWATNVKKVLSAELA